MWLLPFPEQASTSAGQIDAVILALTGLTVFFSALVGLAIFYLAAKYRRGTLVDRSNAPEEHLMVELTWTIIPLIMAIGIFFWATSTYFTVARPPDGAMEISVVGKQWMWKMQQPQGRWEMNRLHVPVGRPVKLKMISEDVIHSFFVPAFRIKQDVFPGKYTMMWFNATKPGTYHLFCAEYCGTDHSGMVGSIEVMEPADYEKWLSTGNVSTSAAAEGERLFRLYGCGGCHGPGGSVRAPSLEGIYNKPVAIEVPAEGNKHKVIIADDRYIHDAIVLPEQEVASGFKPIMPSFRGQLSEEEITKLIYYIRTLGTSNGASNGSSMDHKSSNITAEDVKARTGIVPPNMGRITTPSGGFTGGQPAAPLPGGVKVTGTAGKGNR